MPIDPVITTRFSRSILGSRQWWVAIVLAAGAVSPGIALTRSSSPDIVATTLDGAPFHLGDADGGITVINFWATWCVPCRTEMPALDAYYQAHRRQGLRMLAISMDDASKTKTVRAVAAVYHFPVALQRDARLPATYRPSQLPVTLVFDRAGTLRFDSRRVKPALMDAATLNRIVGPLLAEQPER